MDQRWTSGAKPQFNRHSARKRCGDAVIEWLQRLGGGQRWRWRSGVGPEGTDCGEARAPALTPDPGAVMVYIQRPGSSGDGTKGQTRR
ncbi:hypothetical protein J6590_003859 [Homalodisca vitripennis]|nr:hypothetical protein J6590_003859 [Homalodisca vitripennis]